VDTVSTDICLSLFLVTTDRDVEALLHMCCATWRLVAVISVRVVLEIAMDVGAVCCGSWVRGTCVSLVRTASIFRVTRLRL
jgi:hypothetical protein